MLSKFLLVLLALAVSCGLYAQDFSYGKITKDDFKNIQIDPDAEAIVLREYGLSSVELSNQGSLILRNYTHKKILILKKEGFDYANFSIPLYRGDNNSERDILSGLKGVTYNLVDGKIVQTELDKKNILTERVSDGLSVQKLAFPEIKEGAIVEIRYSIESPFLYNLRSWNFQSYIPKIHSELVTQIPEICRFNVSMRGSRPLTDRKSEPYDTKIVTSVGDVRGSKTVYIMKNIPAFKREDYLTSASNYITTLNFELASYSVPFGPSYNFSRTWADVEKQLMDSDSFGKELKRKNLFREQLATLIKPEMTDREKAIVIYNHIKGAIRWDKTAGMFSDKGIKTALEKRIGNVGDINLALVNALREAKLQASPVILSTRENGFPSFTSPALTDFNYVVAMVELDSTRVFLDASDIHLPFGLIPFKCINFKGRIIDGAKSDWVDLKAEQSSTVSYTFRGDLSAEGHLTGDLHINRSGYAGITKRNEIKESNSIEEYFEKLAEQTTNYKIVDNNLHNLDSVDSHLVETFAIEIKNFASVNGSTMVFNPFFVAGTRKNPFNLEERVYPVDLGSQVQENAHFVLQVPEGFTLSSKPKGMNMVLPGRDARYIYSSSAVDNTVEIQMATYLNKPMFLPEEYLSLKEFFSNIIQSQKVDFTLTKQ